MCREAFTLDQLLADPLTRLVMRSDDVEESEIRSLARRMSAHLGAVERNCAPDVRRIGC